MLFRSLEQACLTLQTLVEKDRLVGIISHVPELAEKIESKIHIRKTNTGAVLKLWYSDNKNGKRKGQQIGKQI